LKVIILPVNLFAMFLGTDHDKCSVEIGFSGFSSIAPPVVRMNVSGKGFHTVSSAHTLGQ